MASTGFGRRSEWRIALVLLAAAPFLLTAWVHGDGVGYAAMLRSAVVTRSLALGDAYAHYAAHMRDDAVGLPARFMHAGPAPGLDSTWQAPKPDAVTGRVPAYYSVGPVIAWAPAYALVHAAVRATAPARADGYGGPYALAIALSSFACGLAGTLLALRIARRVAGEGAAFWAALAGVWATPLVYYLYLSPDYSHALTVLTSGAFFAHWLATRGSARGIDWFVRGALAGALFLARWNDVVLALPVYGLEAVALLRARGPAATARAKLLFALGALLVASPQFAAWQYFHGRPWVRYPEHYAGLPVHGLLQTLFSARHGLFVWTPVALLAVAGLFALAKRDRTFALVAAASLALLVVANCTARDWWAGASFGARRLVSATPLLVAGLAALFDAVPQRAARLAVPALVGLFALWNLLLLGQYALGMISHTDAVPFGVMAANQPRVVAELFARLAGHAR